MKAYTSRLFEGIPLGFQIRGSICTTWTWRVRRGHGFWGTKVGELIQDKYPYFVPNSIKNPEGQHARDVFTSAVAAWQVLSDEDKTWWNTEANRLGLFMSGYNLFIKRYMKDNL